ncbi:hypothetical protein AB0H16_35865, partial [Streptomyces lydicus]
AAELCLRGKVSGPIHHVFGSDLTTSTGPDPRRTELDRGCFRLLTARVRLAQGRPAAAREIFDAGFEIADLREGDETLGDTWYAIAERLLADGGPVTDTVRTRARTEHPLPERYEYRMRPA